MGNIRSAGLVTDPPLTAAQLLLDQGRERLFPTISNSTAVVKVAASIGLSMAARRTMAGEAIDALAELLNHPLGETLLDGWRTHEQLRAAAQSPGTNRITLAAHRVTASHRPYVDLLLSDQQLATLHFELKLEFMVESLAGTVRAGRLVTLEVARCEYAASLLCEGVQLAGARGELQPALDIALPNGGMPLL